jgi:hypothetical protein
MARMGSCTHPKGSKLTTPAITRKSHVVPGFRSGHDVAVRDRHAMVGGESTVWQSTADSIRFVGIQNKQTALPGRLLGTV